jgi:RimJ/RimL family protein N-acetyltransferase
MRTPRKLTIFDAHAVREHFNRLGPESRYLRFMGAMSDAKVADYAHDTPSLGHYAVGCFEDKRLIALGELIMPHWPNSAGAEIAVSVEDIHRGHGIGSDLMARLLTIAANRRVTSVRVTCLSTNARMRRIVDKFHGSWVSRSGAVLEAEIAAGWPPIGRSGQRAFRTRAPLRRAWCSRLKQVPSD